MFIHRIRPLAIFVLLITFGALTTSQSRAEEKLVIHEWGTLTALQDEAGRALPGINIDDEPLPGFCHNLRPYVVGRATALPWIDMKGVPQRHPYVTMRLETPVIYFHPSPQEKLPFSIDVNVEIRGGWLSEFYPQALPDAPGLMKDEFEFGRISPETVGKLSWRGVLVGTSGQLPQTDSHIWNSPRDVNAANVTVGPQTPNDRETESERFLFYRGVGNRPVPLKVEMDEPTGKIALHSQCGDVFAAHQSAKIDHLWLVHIRRDGSVAWRTLDPVTVSADPLPVLEAAGTRFKEDEYSAGHLQTLRKDMHQAMVAGGLFDDEATAMLNTWQHAYFQSPGLRLFFLVPRTWTDAVLPLKFSRAADVQRLMMGRLELISPEQRELLKKLSAMPISDVSWVSTLPQNENTRKFYEGRSDFGDLGVKIPPDYQAYLDLGRFRNALVLNEQKARPTPQLAKFIGAYHLTAFEVR